MEYFEVLGLERDPFPGSPEPGAFPFSGPQLECLQQLEIAIRLRRGLSVALGGPGLGKTAICRELLRECDSSGDIDARLLPDPGADDPAAFAARLRQTLRVPAEGPAGSIHEFQERIKLHLFDQGVTHGRIQCLVIDEGQKLDPERLEILRELLNYETNEFKLLQIAIFARSEFMDRLLSQPNLADRVNYLHELTPLTFRQTREMIATRLALAASGHTPPPRFSLAAAYRLHRKCQGHPGALVRLCREALTAAAGRGKKNVGLADVARGGGAQRPRRR
ncbi:MAG: AAA family ATPase [Desulfovibrionaceae bacterium]|nr:AAA family ATPase [Desulfovibrionaceae bacterium]MBF0514174.1 AAA family ATPase [Desulfovibrionaceae bacterium]